MASNTYTTMSLRLPPKVLRKFKAVCKAEKRTQAIVFETMLAAYAPKEIEK